MSKYKRVLLKLSGEALAGEQRNGFDYDTCLRVASQIAKLVKNGTQVAIVIGGGNFIRGKQLAGIDRAKADYVGILATVMNCLYMSEICRKAELDTIVLTSFTCGGFTELFSKDKAIESMQAGKVVFCAGGTGNPYFTTDTATCLRAIELDVDIILMARAIDGVYDKDPHIYPDAVKFDHISIAELVERQLGIMDMTASVMCMEHHMPIVLFALDEEDSIINNANGQYTGTVVD